MLKTPTTIVAKLIIAILLALAVFVSSLCGQSMVDSGYRGSSYHFRTYRPLGFQSLDEIPSDIRARLDVHLRDRVGQAFKTKLKFDWGEKIDFDELYRIEPYWKSQTVAKYSLLFHFSEKDIGLKAYYCTITLDENGTVVDEIDVPKISDQPTKAKLIPLKRAMEIAGEKGFTFKSTPEFQYFNETDSFVWIFHQRAKNQCQESALFIIGNGPYERIYIEAHTGRVLKTDCYRIVV